MIKLDAFLKELDSIVLSELIDVIAYAIINDHLLDCGFRPLKNEEWDDLIKAIRPNSQEDTLVALRGYQGPFTKKQVSYLAQVIKFSSLGSQSRNYFSTQKGRSFSDTETILKKFFSSVRVLPVTLIKQNPVRKEEFFRKWFFEWSLPILNQTESQNIAQLKKIDFAKTIVEADEAEKKLNREIDKRKKATEELQRQAAQNSYNRGSYE